MAEFEAPLKNSYSSSQEKGFQHQTLMLEEPSLPYSILQERNLESQSCSHIKELEGSHIPIHRPQWVSAMVGDFDQRVRDDSQISSDF